MPLYPGYKLFKFHAWFHALDGLHDRNNFRCRLFGSAGQARLGGLVHEDGGLAFGPTPADVTLSGIPTEVGMESKNLKRQSYRRQGPSIAG